MQSWLKLWIEPNLDGVVRFELNAAERGVYYDLQLLAKKCNHDGYIATETGRPQSKSWIAARLNIARKLLQNTIQKGTTLGLISDTDQGIYLHKFMESQSDYYRQKPYRTGAGRNTNEGSRDYANQKYGHMVQGIDHNDPDKYTKGKYGHMVRR